MDIFPCQNGPHPFRIDCALMVRKLNRTAQAIYARLQRLYRKRDASPAAKPKPQYVSPDPPLVSRASERPGAPMSRGLGSAHGRPCQSDGGALHRRRRRRAPRRDPLFGIAACVIVGNSIRLASEVESGDALD
jgi:hypothetical protein